MKWHTANFGTAAEKVYKEEMAKRIPIFWIEFAREAQTLSTYFRTKELTKLVELVDRLLKPVHHQLMWEVSCEERSEAADQLVFTITPEDNAELRPFAEALVTAAPMIPGWRITYSKFH